MRRCTGTTTALEGQRARICVLAALAIVGSVLVAPDASAAPVHVRHLQAIPNPDSLGIEHGRPTKAGEPGAGVNAGPIQPGAHVFVPIEDDDFGYQNTRELLTGCTLNFIFEDPDGRLFVGSAGHCYWPGEVVVLMDDLSRVGETVFSTHSGEDLVSDRERNLVGIDFSLIAIDEERYADVSPVVLGWGGPVGVANTSEISAGDVIRFYGNGVGARELSRAREGRLVTHDETSIGYALPLSAGDSGGPILHADTGQALATIGGMTGGLTIAGILQLLAEAGFDLDLVTAPPG